MTILTSHSNPEVKTSHSSNTHENMTANSTPSIASSEEASGPPSPTKGPIRNFGEISPGIYRSSFPGAQNIEHLQSLKLKTLITLVTTPFDPVVEEWIASSGIQHYRISVTAHKTTSDTISTEHIASVMKLLDDETKRPILMHCNKGRHRTGCMTAAYCRLRDTEMNVDAIVAHYHEFAQPKARDLDVTFIRGLRREDVWDAMARLEAPIQPICYYGRCNSSTRKTATHIDGLLMDEDDPKGNCKQQPVEIKRVVMGPELPLSPPPAIACKGSGFSVQQLVDALSRICEGRNQDVPTPPASPR